METFQFSATAWFRERTGPGFFGVKKKYEGSSDPGVFFWKNTHFFWSKHFFAGPIQGKLGAPEVNKVTSCQVQGFQLAFFRKENPLKRGMKIWISSMFVFFLGWGELFVLVDFS